LARSTFWPSDDSLVTYPGSGPIAGVPVKIYTQRTGGTQITDLVYVNPDGSLGSAVPSGVLTSDGDGLIPAFAGPDGGSTTVWGDHGWYGARWALSAQPGVGGGGGGNQFTSVLGKTSGTVTGSDIVGDSTVAGAYGPGSDQWLQSNGGGFTFAFAAITTTDTATGLPTAATVRWPDGKTGAFTGTIDGGGNGYSGYAVTWVNGGTTKTLTASGITYTSDGNAIGPTGLAVS
jgi:hypothetical protein